MNNKNRLITQPSNQTENTDITISPGLLDGSSPVGIILAISILIGTLAKLIEVLVPVMKKNK